MCMNIYYWKCCKYFSSLLHFSIIEFFTKQRLFHFPGCNIVSWKSGFFFSSYHLSSFQMPSISLTHLYFKKGIFFLFFLFLELKTHHSAFHVHEFENPFVERGMQFWQFWTIFKVQTESICLKAFQLNENCFKCIILPTQLTY